ncbi:MAG: ETC complex I subunit [Alphaproteobacteria bacterium]
MKAREVRIFQPVRTAMQQGRGRSGTWVLEFVAETPKQRDPLMGWSGSDDTQSQVRIQFSSLDDAVAYADKEGYRYQVHQPRERRIRPKNYADNFKYAKIR